MGRGRLVGLAGLVLAPVLGVASTRTTAADVPAWMPGPTTSTRAEATLRNADCERCHVDVAAEWRTSQHRTAFTSPMFQRAFAHEPLPMCQACHAPEAGPDFPAGAAPASLGVSCLSCHQRPGEAGVLAGPERDPARGDAGVRAPAPHAVVREPAFATARACNGCHEFSFPDGHGLMQSTASEHAQSAYESVPCASCHMPRDAKGHRGHAFASSRSPGAIRAAVTVRAHRIDATRVQLQLSPNRVGHALPTGDMFRRIEVVADVVGPENQALASAEAFLARQFETGPDGVKREVADTRLSGPRTLVLELGPLAEGREIAWRVAYQRLEAPDVAGRVDAEIESEIVMAQGALQP